MHDRDCRRLGGCVLFCRVRMAAREAMYEVVRRPGAGKLHEAFAHHGAGSGKLVLVPLYMLALNQVRNVEDHLAVFGEAAAYFLVKRQE